MKNTVERGNFKQENYFVFVFWIEWIWNKETIFNVMIFKSTLLYSKVLYSVSNYTSYDLIDWERIRGFETIPTTTIF